MFKNGYVKSDLKSFSNKKLKTAFYNFLQQDPNYKENYLQKNFSYGFDGYSYLGQEDSSNQYASDLLHSFVISDFSHPDKFPKEFYNFFKNEWAQLQHQIRKIEREIIQQLNISDLEEFYQKHIGHMISCNYYPKTENFSKTLKNNTRLSEHTDVSLFTVFPFGFDSDFFYQNSENEWVQLEATDQIVIFPGYLLEYYTNGKIKALNHCVKLPESKNKERFSFAYFSLPYPKHEFLIGKEILNSENYFEKYLELF
ncbi:2OG-Fe(II) oxygenase family protein [Bacteroidota bacterium]